MTNNNNIMLGQQTQDLAFERQQDNQDLPNTDDVITDDEDGFGEEE